MSEDQLGCPHCGVMRELPPQAAPERPAGVSWKLVLIWSSIAIAGGLGIGFLIGLLGGDMSKGFNDPKILAMALVVNVAVTGFCAFCAGIMGRWFDGALVGVAFGTVSSLLTSVIARFLGAVLPPQAVLIGLLLAIVLYGGLGCVAGGLGTFVRSSLKR